VGCGLERVRIERKILNGPDISYSSSNSLSYCPTIGSISSFNSIYKWFPNFKMEGTFEAHGIIGSGPLLWNNYSCRLEGLVSQQGLYGHVGVLVFYGSMNNVI
jgi:hypothetical protein